MQKITLSNEQRVNLEHLSCEYAR